MECIFCKISQRSLSADIVYEDGDLMAFKDINPKAPVHLLVIPKGHIQSVAHLEADHQEMIAKLIYAAKEIALRQGLAGYKLVFNVGRAGGQIVDHLHLHLLGGWARPEDWKKGLQI